MVKRIFKLLTRWEYTWFAWMVNIFYLLIWSGALHRIPLSVVFIMVCSMVSALIMASGKWWGCIGAIILDCYLCSKYIYTVYIYYGDFVLSELWLPTLIMVSVAVIHIIMGRMCYMENKKQA